MKKIYLTEEQFKNFLLEELCIADEVVKLSKEIINTILIKCEKNYNGFSFIASNGLNVEVILYNFESNKELSNWFENGGENYLFNGFSYEKNKIIITGIQIKGELDISTIENNVFHEIEHYFQTLKKGKLLQTSGYNKIIDGMKNFNPIISTVCNILYYTKKFELDAIINGFYSDIEKFDLGRETFYEIIKKTEIYKILNNFKMWEDGISKWTQTPIFNSARKYLYETGIIKNITINKLKKQLLKKIYKSRDYILLKIGKVYALHKKKYDSSIRESVFTDLIDMNLMSRIGLNCPVKMKDFDTCYNLKKLF